MANNDIQNCINECESALGHLNKALTGAEHVHQQKMQHAVKDLEECIAACRELL